MDASRRAALASAAAIGLLWVGGPVRAGDALECSATVPGVTARGVPTTFQYDVDKTSSLKRGPDSLGYQPRDIAYPHYATAHRTTVSGPETGATARGVRRSYWFTLSGQQLREVTEVDRRDATGKFISAEYHTRIVRKHWSGVRQISIGQGRDHLYVLTNNDQLLRYRITGKDGNTSVRLDTTVGVGFGTVGTFAYARTFSVLGSPFDVFMATDADSGELLEYTIPVDLPTGYARTVLASGQWYDLRSAGRSATCTTPGSSSTFDGIVAVDISGAVRLWSDRDGSDGLGNDISDRGVIKGLWRPMPYSD